MNPEIQVSEITDILEKKVLVDEKNNTLTVLTDSARLLCDLHHGISKTRQSFITPSLNVSIRPAAYSCVADSLLFGENFREKVRNAKTIERCSKELKNQAFPNPKHNNYKNKRPKNLPDRPLTRPLNSQGPSRRLHQDQHQSGLKPPYRSSHRRLLHH